MNKLTEEQIQKRKEFYDRVKAAGVSSDSRISDEGIKKLAKCIAKMGDKQEEKNKKELGPYEIKELDF